MATSSATNASIALSGLASGIDWTSIVNELLTVERAPETIMKGQQATFQSKSTAYQGIGAQLTTLGKDVTTLSDPNFFDSRTTALTDSSVATATADAGTPMGNYTFKITKMASDAVQQGTSGISAPLSATDDVTTLQVGSAGFATPVTAGTFTVNGKAIPVAATDTLDAVFQRIQAATGVTATYDHTTDEITLTGSGTAPIVLGSATDTSNFLQAAELFNNGTNTITSATGLGGVNLNNPMSSSNLDLPVSDGGSGNGAFMINGVEINFNASSDSINDVLSRINDSAAGVTATYDAINNRFQLTNKTTGDMGISLQDVTGGGNFLEATGLSTGTLQRGTNLQYSINGGGTLTSQSNTVTGTSSGIKGLSLTALSEGTTTVTVSSDTSKISSAINSFVTDYNAAQSFIKTQVATTVDSNGNVTPAVLTGDIDAESITDKLRSLTDAVPPGLTGAVKSLFDMGIVSNGQDNSLSVSDPTTLSNALANNLAAVKQMFTDPTNGIATTLNTYLTSVTGSNGVLASDENNMTKQIAQITSSITALEQRITNDQTRLTNEFVAMETAINTINSQKSFLNQYFGGSGSSSNAAPAAAGSNISSSASSSSSTTG